MPNPELEKLKGRVSNNRFVQRDKEKSPALQRNKTPSPPKRGMAAVASTDPQSVPRRAEAVPKKLPELRINPNAEGSKAMELNKLLEEKHKKLTAVEHPQKTASQTPAAPEKNKLNYKASAAPKKKAKALATNMEKALMGEGLLEKVINMRAQVSSTEESQASESVQPLTPTQPANSEEENFLTSPSSNSLEANSEQHEGSPLDEEEVNAAALRREFKALQERLNLTFLTLRIETMPMPAESSQPHKDSCADPQSRIAEEAIDTSANPPLPSKEEAKDTSVAPSSFFRVRRKIPGTVNVTQQPPKKTSLLSKLTFGRT